MSQPRRYRAVELNPRYLLARWLTCAFIDEKELQFTSALCHVSWRQSIPELRRVLKDVPVSAWLLGPFHFAILVRHVHVPVISKTVANLSTRQDIYAFKLFVLAYKKHFQWILITHGDHL